MEEHIHINPDNGDSISLKLEYETELGIWRVYIQGDRGQKPLHTSTRYADAQKVFDETKAAMMERA